RTRRPRAGRARVAFRPVAIGAARARAAAMTTKDFLDAIESLLYHVTLLERRGDEIRDLRWHRQELEVVCALLYERLRTGEPSSGIRRRAALAARAVVELVDDHRAR